MGRRTKKALWGHSFQTALTAMTRSAMSMGTTAARQTLRAAPAVSSFARMSGIAPNAARARANEDSWSSGIAMSAAGARRYQLFTPPGLKRGERLPLLVMLHGCGQDAVTMAASSRMNQLAIREHFIVLYPEQGRLANAHGCWNWYETRSGRAQGESGTIHAAINQVCLLRSVDPERIALVGFSAGAGMAALLATRHPGRFQAVVMHSGIAPGVAHSSASAISAMRGHHPISPVPLALLTAGFRLPPLLVIHGSADHVVAPGNGSEAAAQWAARAGARAGLPRTLQRGKRYPASVTDFRHAGRLVARLCEVEGLGHAWSGGADTQSFSDPKGPDASRMIWSFVARQFQRAT